MKTFVTAAVVVASAALASAQSTAIFDPSTNSYSCPIANGTYCVGSSNIIIRCINGKGFPGNCNDNLAGEPPINVLVANCYTSPTIPGQAACEKNCIVYGDSGNINGTFSVPGCTPAFSTSTSTTTATNVTVTSATSTLTVVPPPISLTTITPTVIAPVTVAPAGTGFVILPTGAAGTGGVVPASNGTAPGSSTPGSATATPVGPSKTTTGTGAATFTGAAPTNMAAAGIAAAGILVAALL